MVMYKVCILVIYRVFIKNFGIDITSDTNIILRYRYNQDFKKYLFYSSSCNPDVIDFYTSNFMALSVVRKKLGSITNFMQHLLQN